MVTETMWVSLKRRRRLSDASYMTCKIVRRPEMVSGVWRTAGVSPDRRLSPVFKALGIPTSTVAVRDHRIQRWTRDGSELSSRFPVVDRGQTK